MPPREAPYELRRSSGVSSDDYNRGALHLPTNTEYLRIEGMEVSLALPLLTMHTTGDGQVLITGGGPAPACQCSWAMRSAGAARRRDTGHRGFTTSEQEAALAALSIGEHGEVPQDRLAVDDLTKLDRTFLLQPRLNPSGRGHRRR